MASLGHLSEAPRIRGHIMALFIERGGSWSLSRCTFQQGVAEAFAAVVLTAPVNEAEISSRPHRPRQSGCQTSAINETTATASETGSWSSHARGAAEVSEFLTLGEQRITPK